MPETPFSGLTASVKLGAHSSATSIAYISGFDLKLDKSVADVIQFGAGWKEKLPTVKDWSGSCDGTAAFATAGNQKALLDAFINDTVVTIGIYLNETTYFEGTALISSMSLSAAADDKVSITAEFAGSGAIVATIPT